MTNTEFNAFYNNLLAMDEDELHSTVLGMASLVMDRQKELEEQKRREQKAEEWLRIRRERVM